MTEKEWLNTDDLWSMLWSLTMRKPEKNPGLRNKNRLFRLFGCACCRRVWSMLGKDSQEAVEELERYASTFVRKELLATRRKAKAACQVANLEFANDRSEINAAKSWAAQAVLTAASMNPASSANAYGDVERAMIFSQTPPGMQPGDHALPPNDKAIRADHLRDIVGNFFRVANFDSRWRTPTVTALAQAIYDERRLADLPILADALEEAGCTNADLLDHCRSGGEHVRGCWAVDLVLAKD